MQSGSIIVAGSGISLAHMTMETRSYIQASDLVLHVVADSVTADWIKQNSRLSDSMKDYYELGLDRRQIYSRMVERVLEAARDGRRVCAVFYGHPGIFVTPSHEIVERANSEGISVRMLPGISAEDCLVADLGFDPGTVGCHAYEATDFLLYKRVPDVRSWLIVWQPDTVGDIYFSDGVDNGKRIGVLRDYLLEYYGPDDEAIVYEANTYVVGKPHIERFPLKKLCEVEMTGISTLVIPPTSEGSLDEDMVNKLSLREPYSGTVTASPEAVSTK